MNHGKALAIVKNINTAECNDEEKAYAIYLAMKMPTLMSVTKTELIEVIKWLWDRAFEFKADDEAKE